MSLIFLTIEHDVEPTLLHYGVKGMRWGIRKTDPSSMNIRTEGIRVRSDGSMEIDAGVSIQRLIRMKGGTTELKDMTFASISDYDNAKYIDYLGSRKGGRDHILSIQTVKPIKAPSTEESTKMISELFLKDLQFRERVVPYLGSPISDKELAKIKEDPTGPIADKWYKEVNKQMTFTEALRPEIPYVKESVRKQVESKGYNALRDENDVAWNVAKSPIIIFSPEKTLKVITVTKINNEMRKASKETLKQYKKLGKNWTDKHFYE